jgi:F-type H+-transporting ATPase subunit b
MELVTPGIGLIFWMTLSFLILLFLLTKFAWKPVMKGLKEREKSIEEALNAAEKARLETHSMQLANEQLLNEAKQERAELIKEARKIQEKIIAEAKEDAAREAQHILTGARATISSEKAAAMKEIKEQISTLSLLIAEKVIRKELASDKKQMEYIEQLVDEIKLN